MDPNDMEEDNFEKVLSSASCKLDDIIGIIYGGSSSRFWMLRKHVNCLPRGMLGNLPFFSWNCLTLQLRNRDIDLVIKGLDDMRTLLKFLVYKMQTADGSKGSATKLVELMTSQDISEF